MKASFKKHILQFRQASGTSRGVLKTKTTYFLEIENEGSKGIGECALFKGLSYDDVPNYEEKLQWVCNNIHLGKDVLLVELLHFPSIQIGVEQVFLSLESANKYELFPSKFTNGEDAIKINGLVWMGSKEFMQKQIKEKLANGFTTIKLKIGAINFEDELDLIKSIRNQFSKEDITIRVDANGAFTPTNALEKLKRLSNFDLHSIEQPIKQGQWQEMAELCSKTPLDIALDEELIGVLTKDEKQKVLDVINPQYIILKPSLVGGFKGSTEWIELANKKHINWWITSALESNIGLNAIAQYTYNLQSNLPQGLGTGALFTNNIDSPLEVKNGELRYNSELEWENY